MAVLLPTTLVGSYPQPDWLIDRKRLAEMIPPRVRARELWRIDAEWLEQAQDDATILAIRDHDIHRVLLAQQRNQLPHGAPARFANDVTNEENVHAPTVMVARFVDTHERSAGGRWCGPPSGFLPLPLPLSMVARAIESWRHGNH